MAAQRILVLTDVKPQSKHIHGKSVVCSLMYDSDRAVQNKCPYPGQTGTYDSPVACNFTTLDII